VLITAVGIWAYHNSFQGPFIFDDVASIVENPTIRHLWPVWGALTPPYQGGVTVGGRPVINFSLAVNYAINGFHVWGYHAVNLAIHIAAGLVLFGIVRRTLLQPSLRQRFGMAALPLALVIAVIWVVHPLQTESVTYVVQRAESMMGLFYLLTLYCVIRGAESDSPKLWYILSVASCLLGMASKEVMVSAPLIVLLYDRAFIAGSFREAWRRRRSLYLGLGATWICLTYLVVSAERFGTTSAIAKFKGISWWAYLLTEPRVILHYLRLCVWPQPLCLDYLGWPVPGAWTSVLASTAVMVALLGATVWAWRTNSIRSGLGPAWGFLGAWIFLILGPTSSVIPMDSPVYEHRMYLPLAAVAAAVVLGAFEMGKRLLSKEQGVVLGCVAGGAVVVLFTSMTIQRNRDYRSALTIWQDTMEKRPDNARAYNNLGLALVQLGKVQEAIGQYEQALRIKPDYAEAHNNLGVILTRQGRLPEAISQLEQALGLAPDLADTHYNLGIALVQQGKLQEAIGHYEQALRINPDYADAHNNLGAALMGQGKPAEAIGQYEQALRIKPDFADAHYNLGIALGRQGKLLEAISHWEQALRINPDHAEAHNNLGAALMGQGKLPEAIDQCEQALRIKPDFAEAHNNLGAALMGQGNLPEAISQYEQALRIMPDYVDAHNNLGIALVRQGRLLEAISHWEQALRINPEYADVHYNLGIALEKLGRTAEAIQQYEQALRIRPEDVPAQNALARMRAAQ